MRVPFVDVAAGLAEARAELDAAYARVVDSGSLVLGAELAAFEREFAATLGVAHCVGVGNGLDALRIGLQVLGVGTGDEVIVPGHTFIATWLAVTAVGAVPVPVDVERDTGNIDAALVEAAVTERTRAIVPVHLTGRVADMRSLADVAAAHDLRVLEDAAQAHLASGPDGLAGTLAPVAAFSFYPTKNVGALGDAGALVTDDEQLAARARQLRNYGSTTRYRHDLLGTNSRLDELQAAFLRVRLAHLRAGNERRAAIAATYLAELEGVHGLLLPRADSPQDRSAWHLFQVRHPRRDELAALLEQRGIATGIHYPVPPHRSPAYVAMHGAAHLPVSDATCATTLSLPMYPQLVDDQVQAVCAAVRDAARELDDDPA